MTLEEFLTTANNNVSRFEVWYRTHAKNYADEQPPTFPMIMEKDEWDDAFGTFLAYMNLRG